VTMRIRAPILVFSRENAAIASGPLVLIGSYRILPCVAPFSVSQENIIRIAAMCCLMGKNSNKSRTRSRFRNDAPEIRSLV
jgi:hypothetical protein